MKKIAIVALLGACLIPVAPAQAALLATCGAMTPALAPPTIQLPPINPPNVPDPSGIGISGDEPVRPIEGCATEFVLPAARQVTATIITGQEFTGTVGLRVRGIDALWTDFAGRFVGGMLVDGEETKSFQLGAGTWTFEVHLDGPALGPVRRGHTSFGYYSGALND